MNAHVEHYEGHFLPRVGTINLRYVLEIVTNLNIIKHDFDVFDVFCQSNIYTKLVGESHLKS